MRREQPSEAAALASENQPLNYDPKFGSSCTDLACLQRCWDCCGSRWVCCDIAHASATFAAQGSFCYYFCFCFYLCFCYCYCYCC